MKRDDLYIEHIHQSIEKIELYLGDKEFEHIKQDEMLTDALARQLGIIGEAANQLSEAFRSEHPELPYVEMIGMRNFLVHEYANVDRKTVWDTCKEDLPQLKRDIEAILQKRGK